MELIIHVRVTLDTSFNIGSGVSGDIFTNKPMLKDQGGLPFIPGSSLKGRVRQHCEQIAAALNLDPKLCNAPLAEAMCQPGDGTRDTDGVCVVCRVFGSPWFAAPVAFSDLQLDAPKYLLESREHARSSVRYGVGISRQRRVAEDQLLYTTEVFQPGNILTLAGAIRGQLEESDLQLLIAGLDSLFTLGSNKTRGMGWCRVELNAKQKAGAEWQTYDLNTARRRWTRDANTV